MMLGEIYNRHLLFKAFGKRNANILHAVADLGVDHLFPFLYPLEDNNLESVIFYQRW